MNLELVLLVSILAAGLFTYFISSNLVERIPYNLNLAWRRELTALEEDVEPNFEDFKISIKFKLVLSAIAMLIASAILLDGELTVETYGFFFLFLVIILVVGINLRNGYGITSRFGF